MSTGRSAVVLGEIADIKIGFLLGRHKTEDMSENVMTSDVLSLRSINEDGTIDEDKMMKDICFKTEMYQYQAELGEVVIRLSYPYTAAVIDKNSGFNALVPSQFARIHLQERDYVHPEYLAIFLNSTMIKKRFERASYGAVVSVVKVETLKAIRFAVPVMEKQMRIIELNHKMLEERRLQEELIERRIGYIKGIIESVLKDHVIED